MNLKYLWSFIQSNLLTIVLTATFLVAAPQILGVFALIVARPICVGIVLYLLFAWRMYKIRRHMEEQFREAAGEERPRRERTTSDGNVTIIVPEQHDKRINDDVGEYVDFKEIKEEK